MRSSLFDNRIIRRSNAIGLKSKKKIQILLYYFYTNESKIISKVDLNLAKICAKAPDNVEIRRKLWLSFGGIQTNLKLGKSYFS